MLALFLFMLMYPVPAADLHRVTLSWQEADPTAVRYRVSVSTNGGMFLVAGYTVNKQYTLKQVPEGNYCYRVRAINAAGKLSAVSNTYCVVIP